MSNPSITNKLIANIRQANDISKNFFTDTNRVVCIDSSNTRIGINTRTPQWSIDISGDGSYNGVKCHNLDISGRADISYSLIKELRAPIISGDFITISNGYFKKIDASLIDINEVIFNTISGDFIYSNNTISGNFLECFSGVILNNLDICGKLQVTDFTFEKDVSFNIVNVDESFTTKNTTISNFLGRVDFCNNNVKYQELSGNHINTFSLSCENLQVNQQADFTSINVLSEASFNTINVAGEASFNTISAENINISGQTLSNFLTNNTQNLYTNYQQNIDINTLKGKKIYIENINKTTLEDNYNVFSRTLNKDKESFINKLTIGNSLDLSYNSNGTSLILPYKQLDNTADRKIGNIYYSITDGVIDGIKIIKNNPSNTSINDIITLKQLTTMSYMLKEDSTKSFQDYGGYKCVKMTTHPNSQIKNNVINNPSNYFANIANINTNIIEVNANITVSLNNDNNGKDVDALNYDFCIFGLKNNSYNEISNYRLKLVSNNNSILVFDNSYNYNSTSLHYIGEKQEIETSDTIQFIVFGVSYENVLDKDLSLNLENFSASIKSVN